MVKYTLPSNLYPYLYIADNLYVKNVEYKPFASPQFIYFDYDGAEISVDPKTENIYIQFGNAEGTLSYNESTDAYFFTIEQLFNSAENQKDTYKIVSVAKAIMKLLVQLEMMSVYNMENIVSQHRIKIVS